MEISFDPDKRARTLAERGLDFADAARVFAGRHFDVDDARRDYGERRVLTFGFLGARAVVLVWTERRGSRRIISMRHANERERKIYKKYLD
jgi:uncharacterized protein